MTPTRPAASSPAQSPTVFGGSPKGRVQALGDPKRYVRWLAYDKPVEFTTAVQALVTRRGWTNPWNPASPLGKLAEAKREHVQLRRGEAETVAHSAEQAKRFWTTRRDVALAERIGRESTSILDREELIAQLLARDEENAALVAECAHLRHDMSLMTEALRQVVEAQENATKSMSPKRPTTCQQEEDETHEAKPGEEIINEPQHPPAYAHALKYFSQHWDPRRRALQCWARSARNSSMRREQAAWRSKALAGFVNKWKNLALVPAFKGWREKVKEMHNARLIIKRAAERWKRRSVASALRAWYPWAKDRITLRNRLKKTIHRWAQLKLSAAMDVWREKTTESARCALRWSGKTLTSTFKVWSEITLEARRLEKNKMMRGGDLRRAAVIMQRTRVRASVRSVLVAWRAVAIQLLEIRGRKSATSAAAEAEVETAAAMAALQVVKRELRDALADVERLKQELRLRKERDLQVDEVETMREEMMALAERLAYERITSRDEIAELERRHKLERSSWKRERAAIVQRVTQLERLLGSAHGMNDVKAANDLASVLADSLNEFRHNVGNVFSSPAGGNVGSRLDEVLQRTFNHTTTKVLRSSDQRQVLAGAARAVSKSSHTPGSAN